MYDMKTYLATKDSPGGPIFIEEEFTPEYLIKNHLTANEGESRPLTLGETIGRTISVILLLGVGVYLFIAL